MACFTNIHQHWEGNYKAEKSYQIHQGRAIFFPFIHSMSVIILRMPRYVRIDNASHSAGVTGFASCAIQ